MQTNAPETLQVHIDWGSNLSANAVILVRIGGGDNPSKELFPMIQHEMTRKRFKDLTKGDTVDGVEVRRWEEWWEWVVGETGV